jgi:hypothetical protein
VAYRPVAKQWLCKQQSLLCNRRINYNNGNGVFYVVRAEIFLAGWAEFQMVELSVVQLRDVMWNEWLVSQRVQLPVESRSVKRKFGGWCAVAAAWDPVSWVVGSQRVLYGRLWQEDLSTGSWRISVDRSLCQETASGDCNRLRTIICVCQWSVKCSSEWCIQVINKSIHQSNPRL